MREHHPYGVFIPKHPKAMIIGSFPIGKFTRPERRNEIKKHELDFFFGGEKNFLRKLLGQVFKRPLSTRAEVIAWLEEYGIGIGDVIQSCIRKEGGASDSELTGIKWNQDLLHVIDRHHISLLIFTSRKVEQWFDRLFPEARKLSRISLISPSGQSLRGLSRHPDYLSWKLKYPQRSWWDFILSDYRKKLRVLKPVAKHQIKQL